MSCSSGCLSTCLSSSDQLFISQRAAINFGLYSSIFEHIILIKTYTALLVYIDEMYTKDDTYKIFMHQLKKIYNQYNSYYDDFTSLKDIDFGSDVNGCIATKKIPASDFFDNTIKPLSSSKSKKTPSLKEIYDELSTTLPRLKNTIDDLIYEKSKDPRYLDVNAQKIFEEIYRIELLAKKYKNYSF